MKNPVQTVSSIKEDLYATKCRDQKNAQIIKLFFLTLGICIALSFIKVTIGPVQLYIVLIVLCIIIAFVIGFKLPFGEAPAQATDEEVKQEVIQRSLLIDYEQFELLMEKERLETDGFYLTNSKKELIAIGIELGIKEETLQPDKVVNKKATIQNVLNWANLSDGHGLNVEKFNQKMESNNWQKYLIEIANACGVEIVYE